MTGGRRRRPEWEAGALKLSSTGAIGGLSCRSNRGIGSSKRCECLLPSLGSFNVSSVCREKCGVHEGSLLRSDFRGFSLLKEVMVLQYCPVNWSRPNVNSEESFAVNSIWLDSLG